MKHFSATHYKILGALRTLDGAPTRIDNLYEFLGLPAVESVKAVKELIDDGYVTINDLKVSITMEGAGLFGAVCDNSKDDPEGYFAFRNEALTGCDSKGHQSKICNAALPSGKKYYHNAAGKAHDQMMDLARKLKMSTEQCIEWIELGRIRECRKCGEVAVHSTRGKYNEDVCNKCNWIREKERRKSK